MVTTASKLFFPAGLVALVASWAYGIGTGGELIGVIFMGFKGAVGEIAGYVILQVAAAVLLGFGTVAALLRDADPEAQAAAARLESLPPAVAPGAVSYWPALGALGAVVAAIGLVASPVLFVMGLLGVGLVMLEWMVSAWSERATGDPSINRRIRNRLMYPIEIPVAAALTIAVLVLSVSRVLLALPANGASAIAIVVAALVLLFGFLFAYRPSISKDAIAVLVVIAATAVIAGGIIAAASGTREFEEHHVEEGLELAPAAEGSEG